MNINYKKYLIIGFYIILILTIINSMITINDSILKLSEKELNTLSQDKVNNNSFLSETEINKINKEPINYSKTTGAIIRDIVLHLINIFICLIIIILAWITEKINRLKDINSLN